MSICAVKRIIKVNDRGGKVETVSIKDVLEIGMQKHDRYNHDEIFFYIFYLGKDGKNESLYIGEEDIYYEEFEKLIDSIEGVDNDSRKNVEFSKFQSDYNVIYRNSI